MTESQSNALKLLASQHGGFLILQQCTPETFLRFRLSQLEAVQALKELESQGLVASIYERLDGLVFALSKSGRELMLEKGCQFQDAKIELIIKLFKEWQCKTSM